MAMGSTRERLAIPGQLAIFVGQAFQPDFPKRQAGKLYLPRCDWDANGARVLAVCRVIEKSNDPTQS
jgi:hypothetical protein